jgi:D-tyrosyl-tRNA(Tyr) deacylase
MTISDVSQLGYITSQVKRIPGILTGRAGVGLKRRLHESVVEARQRRDGLGGRDNRQFDGAGSLICWASRRATMSATRAFCAQKTAQLRIFPDEEGKMNRSLLDVAAARWWYRSSRFAPIAERAAAPLLRGPRARALRGALPRICRSTPPRRRFVRTDGKFAAHMLVELQNDGPVTILLER